MPAARRVALAGLVALGALVVGYASGQALEGGDRRPVPAIDLDGPAPVEGPPPTAAPEGGARIVPLPTVAPQAAPSPPAPGPPGTGPPPTPPPPADDDDDDGGDAEPPDDDEDDAGEPDDD